MKKKFFTIATMLTVLGTITIQSAFADTGNTTTTATLSGTVTVSGAGAWSSGIGMTGSVHPTAAKTATWSSSAGFGTDYIAFVDNNAAADGAYLSAKLQTSRYNFAGAGVGNTGLVLATRSWMAIGYGPVAPAMGNDSTSKNANIITAETCSGSQSSAKTLFHTNMRSNSQFYKLGLDTTNKTLFRILPTSECTTTVKVGLKSVYVTYPALTTSGTYTNTLILTSTDGAV